MELKANQFKQAAVIALKDIQLKTALDRGAKGADVGAVTANFDSVFMALDGATHSATLLALDQTGQTRFDTTFKIFHLLILDCERVFTPKGLCFITMKLYAIFSITYKIRTSSAH